MDKKKRKRHWENIFESKQPNKVSWYQETPATSLAFFNSFNLPKDAEIIDVGGGDSFMVDNLIELGYQNITVLDISEKAPKKCSGLEIRQYSEMSLSTRLKNYFQKIKCITVDHRTPFNTIQIFLFCSFKRLNLNVQ